MRSSIGCCVSVGVGFIVGTTLGSAVPMAVDGSGMGGQSTISSGVGFIVVTNLGGAPHG